MNADVASRIACAIAVALNLSACGRPSPDQSASATPPRSVAVKPAIAQPVPTSAAKATIASVIQDSESTRASPPPWLAELLNNPDPQVRLEGLEAWAHHPEETLDAVTYALVDPDESVRARAQALFEEALARR
jgi:hypothetical protein